MIGEPELDGAWDADRPAEEIAKDEPPTALRGRARPWWWALGGAVVASAVWAGTLAAQDRFTSAPRLAYRHVEDLCEEVPLTELAKTTGAFDRNAHTDAEGPAMDWSFCDYGTIGTEGNGNYMAQVLVELHKKTDPEAEFAAGPSITWAFPREPASPEAVPGLGERALVSGTVLGSGLQLEVLDGGAVFSMSLAWWGADESREVLDDDSAKSAMIEQMRSLMATLKK